MKRAVPSREMVLPAAAAGGPCPREGGSLVAALVRHYDELVDYLRRHIGLRGGDRTHARDVLHDIYLELVDAPPAEDVRTPVAFLRRVASRRAIDLYRSEAAWRARVDSVAELPEVADERACAQDPARIVAGRQRLQVLVAAIQALPPRCREVFVMHKIHELPQSEVASRLDVSIKTVEKHLRLGMLSCRRALEEASAGEGHS